MLLYSRSFQQALLHKRWLIQVIREDLNSNLPLKRETQACSRVLLLTKSMTLNTTCSYCRRNKWPLRLKISKRPKLSLLRTKKDWSSSLSSLKWRKAMTSLTCSKRRQEHWPDARRKLKNNRSKRELFWKYSTSSVLTAIKTSSTKVKTKSWKRTRS